jgi:hypothetical protein
VISIGSPQLQQRMHRNGKLTLRAEKENVDLAIAPETQKLNW